MAAVSIGSFFKITLQNIKQSIASYNPTNNRSQVIESGGNTIILDAYNANPTSMKAALISFSNMDAGNKAVVLGDMFELGDDSEGEHKEIVDLIAQLGFDSTILVGPQFKKVASADDLAFENTEQAIVWFNEANIHDYAILIKGSRGMHLEDLVK